MNLNVQMLAGFSLVMLVTLFLAYNINYTYMTNVLKEKHKQETLNRMEQVNDRLESFSGNINSILNYTLGDSTIEKLSHSVYTPMNFYKYTQYVTILENLQNTIQENEYLSSIYIYTSNGYIVGYNQGSRIVRASGNDVDILKTDYFKELQSNYYAMIWTHNIPSQAFANRTIINLAADLQVLSAGKSSRSIAYNSDLTVIVNVELTQFRSLFEPLFDSETDSVYIVDSDNTIISSQNPTEIGDAFHIDISGLVDESGYFSSDLTDSPIQVVYYKIRTYNWYIVLETPDASYHNDIAKLQSAFLLTFIACFFITLFFVMVWANASTRPLSVLRKRMQDVGNGQLGVQITISPKNEFGDAIRYFNEMSTNLARLDEENKVIAQQRRDQELKALRAQINPHFIYNTLNMIKWMAVIQNSGSIVDCIVALSDILKPIFKTSDEMITIKEDILYIENYVKILNYRYNNKIKLNLLFDEKYNQELVPRFIFQPLIENSVQHGVYDSDQQIVIDIDIEEDHDMLTILIHDNGQEISEVKAAEINDLLAGKSIGKEYESGEKVGIYNVNKRIKLYFGEKYGLSIVNRGARGTTVSIRIPKGAAAGSAGLPGPV